jgi:hypothetical protein
MPKSLSQHMQEIVSLFDYPKNQPNFFRYTYEVRNCPKCQKVITTLNEYETLIETGSCFSCSNLPGKEMNQ